MNTDFTPGPWKVAGSCHVKAAGNQNEFYHVAHVALADDYADNPMIADVCNRGHFVKTAHEAHKPSAEQLANARLIAASPDLFAACQVAADALRIIDEHHGNEPSNTRKMLEAALALVESEDA